MSATFHLEDRTVWSLDYKWASSWLAALKTYWLPWSPQRHLPVPSVQALSNPKQNDTSALQFFSAQHQIIPNETLQDMRVQGCNYQQTWGNCRAHPHHLLLLICFWHPLMTRLISTHQPADACVCAETLCTDIFLYPRSVSHCRILQLQGRERAWVPTRSQGKSSCIHKEESTRPWNTSLITSLAVALLKAPHPTSLLIDQGLAG